MAAATAPLIPASKRPLTVISESVVTDATARTVVSLIFLYFLIYNCLIQ
jgi:hypothetical protein